MRVAVSNLKGATLDMLFQEHARLFYAAVDARNEGESDTADILTVQSFQVMNRYDYELSHFVDSRIVIP